MTDTRALIRPSDPFALTPNFFAEPSTESGQLAGAVGSSAPDSADEPCTLPSTKGYEGEARGNLAHGSARPRLLDLYCGAGGSAMGYYRAGFDVIGVDIKPQPHYPFEFHQGDVALISHHWIYDQHVDAIHASPPCQRWALASNGRDRSQYPDLIPITRKILEFARVKAWVIENVPRAPIRADYRVCGCQMGLALRRVRLFESSWHGGGDLLPPCAHYGPVVSVVGHGTPTWMREKLGRNPTIADYRAAMGIDWMNRDELSQAIPPAYTEFIGKQMLAQIEAVRVA